MTRFLTLLMPSPEDQPLLSSEHFSVAGILLRSSVSNISLERIDGSDDEPPSSSGGNGFGSTAAMGKNPAKGDFQGLLLSSKTHRAMRFCGRTPPCPHHGTCGAKRGRRGGSAIDGHRVHHTYRAQSIIARKRIEQVFGWIKQAAGLGQLKARGRSRGGCGVPAACDGLQPGPLGQPAQPTGGAGMRSPERRDRNRFRLRREACTPVNALRRIKLPQ